MLQRGVEITKQNPRISYMRAGPVPSQPRPAILLILLHPFLRDFPSLRELGILIRVAS
jgi:hypothetical protein